jgi:type II secretory pathway pseudopilin PulG
MNVRWHASWVVGRDLGFTLVELLLVGLIVIVLASIAVPRFTGAMAPLRVDGAAERVRNDLNLARRQARLSGTSQTVSFNVPAGSYRLVGYADIDHPASEYEVRLHDPPYEVSVISADFGGDGQVIFDGYGVPDSGGSVVIRSGSAQQTVSVDPDTGQARLE